MEKVVLSAYVSVRVELSPDRSHAGGWPSPSRVWTSRLLTRAGKNSRMSPSEGLSEAKASFLKISFY